MVDVAVNLSGSIINSLLGVRERPLESGHGTFLTINAAYKQ